jgi:hypothetical protein
MEQLIHAVMPRTPWNKGKLVGQKAPLKLKDIGRFESYCQTRHFRPISCGRQAQVDVSLFRLRRHAMFELPAQIGQVPTFGYHDAPQKAAVPVNCVNALDTARSPGGIC